MRTNWARLVGGLAFSAMLATGCSTTPDDGGSSHDTSQAGVNSMDVATIQTFERRPSQCISPISVININGRELTTGLQQFSVPPGTYTLRGRAVITGNFCRSMAASSGGRSNQLEPLEYDFEAGKIYSVGVNHQASNARGWFLTVWQVQDTQP